MTTIQSVNDSITWEWVDNHEGWYLTGCELVRKVVAGRITPTRAAYIFRSRLPEKTPSGNRFTVRGLKAWIESESQLVKARASNHESAKNGCEMNAKIAGS